tara:strand:- start:4332 stop:5354 length:1023 start_codon:yes stop_codon:yes gene_type:complete
MFVCLLYCIAARIACFKKYLAETENMKTLMAEQAKRFELPHALSVVAWVCLCSVNVAQETDSTFDGSNWMAQVNDKISLGQITMPGTHNSGALLEPITGTAACQTLSIQEQLEAGVRFFDLRCRHENDVFTIYHGPVFQKQTLDDVLNEMKRFLEQNTKEVLLVSLKQENSPRNISRTFEDTVRSYVNRDKSLWHLGQDIPKIGDVRGKLVMLRRFITQKALGIDATNWGHSGFYQGRQLFIQDRFELPNDKVKWNLIIRAMEHAIENSDQEVIQLNFTSGYVKSFPGIPNITKISEPINQQLLMHLKSLKPCRLGCIVTDFTTTEICKSIYQLNFPRAK